MKKTVDFIIYQGALGLDITGPLEVFNTASLIIQQATGAEAGYDIRFLGPTRGTVRLSSGLDIQTSHTYGHVSKCDTLVVPGGQSTYQALADTTLREHVRAKAAMAQRIVSVCSGAFILAEAGLLDGRQATTHWMVIDEFQAKFPRVKVVQDAIYTCDGNIHTSAGVTAGIDLALALVEADYGISVAVEVSRYLLVYFRRPGSQSQFSSPVQSQAAAGKRFARLHDWLLNNLSKSISVDEMATNAAMSTRHFSRVFKTTTGVTPGKYLETLRLDRAREILAAGDDAIDSIAKACGFGREDRLRRAFLRKFKVTPSQYRFHFR